MITWINTTVLAWSFIFLMACIGLVSAGFDRFIENLIYFSIVAGGIALLAHKVYMTISTAKYKMDVKKTSLDRERAEIENIRAAVAIPRHYRPSLLGVTPTPTPLHPESPEEQPAEIKIPVFKNGRVILYANDHKKAQIGNMYFERNADGTKKHTITDIAKKVYGNKGGWQNGMVKETINEMKDFYQE